MTATHLLALLLKVYETNTGMDHMTQATSDDDSPSHTPPQSPSAADTVPDGAVFCRPGGPGGTWSPAAACTGGSLSPGRV